MHELPSPFTPPTLRSDLPTYPHLLQAVRVTSTTVIGPIGFMSSGLSGMRLYVSSTQQLRTDALMPRDREPCLALDLNQLDLTPGYYLGRLAGSYLGLPVYEIVSSLSNSITRFITYVSNVCPDGMGGAVVEYTTINIITGEVVRIECVSNPTNCCGSGSGCDAGISDLCLTVTEVSGCGGGLSFQVPMTATTDETGTTYTYNAGYLSGGCILVFVLKCNGETGTSYLTVYCCGPATVYNFSSQVPPFDITNLNIGPCCGGTDVVINVHIEAVLDSFASCGHGSGSGTGSGGGGTITTTCCVEPIPLTLHATISGGTGCSCANGTYTLDYYYPGGYWTYDSASGPCGGTRFVIALQCLGSTWNVSLTIFSSDFSSYTQAGGAMTINSCSPLSLTVSSSVSTSGVGPYPCSGGTLTITVTE